MRDDAQPTVSQLKSAIEKGRMLALPTKPAEKLLAQLVQKQDMSKELEAAIANKREDRLIAAIAQAKTLSLLSYPSSWSDALRS